MESEDDDKGVGRSSNPDAGARGSSYHTYGGKDPLTGKYHYGTRKCSVYQKLKLIHDFSPDEADLDASKRCCTSCSQAIVNALRSLESASTLPTESNSKQNEGDAKDEVPNASALSLDAHTRCLALMLERRQHAIVQKARCEHRDRLSSGWTDR